MPPPRAESSPSAHSFVATMAVEGTSCTLGLVSGDRRTEPTSRKNRRACVATATRRAGGTSRKVSRTGTDQGRCPGENAGLEKDLGQFAGAEMGACPRLWGQAALHQTRLRCLRNATMAIAAKM